MGWSRTRWKEWERRLLRVDDWFCTWSECLAGESTRVFSFHPCEEYRRCLSHMTPLRTCSFVRDLFKKEVFFTKWSRPPPPHFGWSRFVWSRPPSHGMVTLVDLDLLDMTTSYVEFPLHSFHRVAKTQKRLRPIRLTSLILRRPFLQIWRISSFKEPHNELCELSWAETW